MSWTCAHCNFSNDDDSNTCHLCGSLRRDSVAGADTNLQQRQSVVRLRVPIKCPACKEQTYFLLGEPVPSYCDKCGSHFESNNQFKTECRIICTVCGSMQIFRPGKKTLSKCPVCDTAYSPETTLAQLAIVQANQSNHNTASQPQHENSQSESNHSPNDDFSSSSGTTFENTQNTEKKVNKQSAFAVWAVLLFALAFLLVIVFSGKTKTSDTAEGGVSSSASATPVPSSTTKVFRFPSNGQVYYNSKTKPLAPFSIDATQCNDPKYYYVVLTDYETGKAVVRIFIHSQNTVEVNVPLGEYKCYFACGDTWYGYREKFGDDGYYEEADGVFRFYSTPTEYMGHQITLYSVANGNLDSDKISKEEFPN